MVRYCSKQCQEKRAQSHKRHCLLLARCRVTSGENKS
jgi:hypothetical protein